MDKNKFILENLVLYNPVNGKRRLGHTGDGGYVIIEGYQYDCFITCGIYDEITFEIDFDNLYPNIPSFAFDESGGRPSTLPTNIRYEIKSINETNNLKTLIDNYNDIFIKMDIEGGEWKWINSLGDSLRRVKQLVIEVHAVFPETLEDKWFNNNNYSGVTKSDLIDNILSSLKKINETHYLVHVHENNIGPFVRIIGNEYPTYYELTFIRKDCEINGLNTNSLPINGLDYSCAIGGIDRPINFWPFKNIY